MDPDLFEPFSDYLVVTFPSPWPPAIQERLYTSRKGALERELVGYPDGHLALRLRSAHLLHEVHFQRVRPACAGDIIVTVTWDAQEGRCCINQTELRQLDQAGTQVLEFFPTTPAQSHVAPIHFTAQALEKMPRWEWLFVNTLLDLENKIASGTPYELIRSSGLVRHLILDGNPLVSTVTRTYRLNPMYNVISRT